jgi:hypothetical protein
MSYQQIDVSSNNYPYMRVAEGQTGFKGGSKLLFCLDVCLYGFFSILEPFSSPSPLLLCAILLLVFLDLNDRQSVNLLTVWTRFGWGGKCCFLLPFFATFVY